jgi:hypothetical protein
MAAKREFILVPCLKLAGKSFEPFWQQKLFEHGGVKRDRAKSLCLSEIVTKRNCLSSKLLPEFQAFLSIPGTTTQ